MKSIRLFVFTLLMAMTTGIQGQKQVAITLDDVPNTRKFEKDNYQSKLLSKLDSLQIPITLFINEGLIYKTDSIAKNFELLHRWAQRDYVTLANHSFAHLRYSEWGLTRYTDEIIKGEAITRPLAEKYKKPLDYFRFPYNDLGKDSLQHAQIRQFLAEKEYVIAPFTIESSDWMYNRVYEYYLDQGDHKKAKAIGEAYVNKTLEYFEFFESLAQKEYQREVNHIYLGHDNALNADYLPLLIQHLKDRGYKFISMKQAMTDPIYSQSDHYYKKWGVSWFYRWQTTQAQRSAYMRKEPSTEDIIQLYEQVSKTN